MTTYALDALRKNRASMLLFGGSEAERRAFASSVPPELEGASFVEARDVASLEKTFGQTKAVVYVPDVSALPAVSQRALVRVLREKEERAKYIIGLQTGPDTAVEKGTLTEDLRFWLRQATVDVKSKAARR
ncbi:MAG: hypothetical protein DI536_09355 [Archangium gephyra]|uniref:Uncharacterized protein n=1 Tax=Archangium gephyra TaxID=48 RepID=A0A2W5VFU5_9BACT|nr:MAG: hypothetical protein DI536_09355 [Archangium gephyra]